MVQENPKDKDATEAKAANRRTWLASAVLMLVIWVVFGIGIVLYAQWKHPEVFTLPPAGQAASGSPALPKP